MDEGLPNEGAEAGFVDLALGGPLDEREHVGQNLLVLNHGFVSLGWKRRLFV